MLQFLPKNSYDILRISKIISKYQGVKANIRKNVISLDGSISESLLDELCESMDIAELGAISNFSDSETFFAETNKQEKIENIDTLQTYLPLTIDKEYDLLFSTVKRGEVYLCDFGKPYGSEQAYLRPAIIIQNDDGNLASPTTILVPCTTQFKTKLPTHYSIVFSSENTIDISKTINLKKNTVLTEAICTFDKHRLREYLGTLKPDFMKYIEEKIDISLNLKRKVETVVETKTVYVDKPVYRDNFEKQETVTVEPKTKMVYQDINQTQIMLLKLVDLTDFQNILHCEDNTETKIKKILELFGFNFNKKGIQYILTAITLSLEESYFTLETLTEKIASKENVSKDEVMRLMIARIKENFRFPKAPTIEFIRLVNNFLTQ